jgi:hypothetical protein
MKSFNLGVGIVVASLTLAAPAFAQKPESGGSPAGNAVDRSSGAGATSNGSAVDRSGGGSVVSSSSGAAVSTGVSSDVSSPSASAASSPSISFGDRAVREFAPQHRAEFSRETGYMPSDDGQKATPRASGPSGGGGSGTAVSRGGGSSGGESASSGGGSRSGSGESGSPRATGRTRTAPPTENAAGSNNASGAREVPTWSRPRGDRPATGTAVDRTTPRPDQNGNGHGGYGYGSGFYDPYGFYNYGYGGYSPYYGYYYPYGFGMGYGLYSGFGWAPYYGDPFGDPYGGYGYGGGYTTSYGRGEQGNLKLKVKPRSAKVYVDGYFVGYVDQFDGAFQKLALNTGRHKVEVKADGFETAEFDVLITPEKTITFQGELRRIQ